MKSLLVTGCAGFIGSHFCELFAHSYRIIGIDKLGRGSHEKNISPDILFYQKDIVSADHLKEIFVRHPEIEAIINFAAESHVDYSLVDDSPFWSTNVQGMHNLARIALRKKIRLVQVSTDEVYGPSEDGKPFLEDDPIKPRNPYAASKAAADLMVLSYYHSYGLDGIITRGTNTIGPRQSPDKALPKAVACFLEGRFFPLYQTPAKRVWIGAQDHARGIHQALLKGRSGEIYNLSPDSSHEIETETLIERVRLLIGQGEIRKVPDRLAYDLGYRISSIKARQELEWQSLEPIDCLLQDTVRWYQDHSDWLKTHPLRRTIS